MTYTVTTQEGEYPRRGLSLAEAANEILSSDSREWKIVGTEIGLYRIWSRQQVANIGWSAIDIATWADSVAEAEAEMFQQVIDQSWGWRGHDIAVTDAEYNRTVFEIE